MQPLAAIVPTAAKRGFVATSAVLAVLALPAASAFAEVCIVQNGRAYGDCEIVQRSRSATAHAVFESGAYSGNYGHAVIRSRADVTLSGNIDDITVEPGARLNFSGNARRVQVWGLAELTGNGGHVVVHGGGTAIIQGTVDSVSGPGHIIAARGSVIGGVPVN